MQMSFEWLNSFLGMFSDIMGVQLLPGISIGLLVGVLFALRFILFLARRWQT